MSVRERRPADRPAPEELAGEALVEKLRRATELTLLLDYDGTLVPLAPTPAEAAPDRELLDLLRALASRPRTHVEVVSGRDRETIEQWLGALPIALRAEHGASTRRSGGARWSEARNVSDVAVAAATAQLRQLTAPFGGTIEAKRTGAAWHYRGLRVVDAVLAELVHELAQRVAPAGFEVFHGACVIETRVRGNDKSLAVVEALERSATATIVAIGDDTTDEDMFRSLGSAHVGILVADDARPSAASHRLARPHDVRAFLAALLQG